MYSYRVDKGKEEQNNGKNELLLKKEIEKNGKSQSEIARHLQVKQQMVNDYVCMKSSTSPDTFAKIRIFRDLDANDILAVSDV